MSADDYDRLKARLETPGIASCRVRSITHHFNAADDPQLLACFAVGIADRLHLDKTDTRLIDRLAIADVMSEVRCSRCWGGGCQQCSETGKVARLRSAEDTSLPFAVIGSYTAWAHWLREHRPLREKWGRAILQDGTEYFFISREERSIGIEFRDIVVLHGADIDPDYLLVRRLHFHEWVKPTTTCGCGEIHTSMCSMFDGPAITGVEGLRIEYCDSCAGTGAVEDGYCQACFGEGEVNNGLDYPAGKHPLSGDDAAWETLEDNERDRRHAQSMVLKHRANRVARAIRLGRPPEHTMGNHDELYRERLEGDYDRIAQAREAIRTANPLHRRVTVKPSGPPVDRLFGQPAGPQLHFSREYTRLLD